MLVKFYIGWGLLVVTTFAALAASGTRVPSLPASSGGVSHTSGGSYHSYSSGGWGFGK